MTRVELEFNGKRFVFLVAPHDSSEKNLAWRELRSAGFSDPNLTSGKYAGTEVVATFNRLWDEHKIKPVVLAK